MTDENPVLSGYLCGQDSDSFVWNFANFHALADNAPSNSGTRHCNTTHGAASQGSAPPDWRCHARIITLGNFDGFHRGHQALLAKTRALADGARYEAALISFNPHPAFFFQPSRAHFRLNDPATQAELARHFGMDRLIHIVFDTDFSKLSAEDFVTKVLIGSLNAKALIIGDDFHFGHRRAGNPQLMQALAAKSGVATHIVQRLEEDGAPISSSAIRVLLAAGNVNEAAGLLGYPFFITAPVIHGRKLGRTLGYPTANQSLDATFGLKFGIYAVKIAVAGQVFDGVASYGRRPTIDDGAPMLETHVFGFDGDLYGQTMRVHFYAYLRGEEKFASLEALKAQMAQDCIAAKASLAAGPNRTPVPLCQIMVPKYACS